MTLVRTLDRMQQDGLIERRPDPATGAPIACICARRRGRSSQRMWKIAEQARSEALATLSPGEREQLVDLLERVHDTLLARAAGGEVWIAKRRSTRNGEAELQPSAVACASALDADDRRRGRWRWSPRFGTTSLTGRYVSTDDSSVQAAQTTISANIAGTGGRARRARQSAGAARRGAVPPRRSPVPHRGRGGTGQARGSAACRSALPRPPIATSWQISVRARDTLAYQQHEFERQQRLLQSGISSRAQFEQTQHALAAGAVAAQFGAAAGRQRAGPAGRQSESAGRSAPGGAGGAGGSR